MINDTTNPVTKSPFFQMYKFIPIPGAIETTASPVTPHTTMGITEKNMKVSENSTNEDNSEKEEGNFSTDTPSLMLEISAALDSISRTETAVFSVDASDSDSDNTVEYNAPESTKPT